MSLAANTSMTLDDVPAVSAASAKIGRESRRKRPSLAQRYGAFQGAVLSVWASVPQLHPLLDSVELCADGVLRVVDEMGETIELTIGRDAGVELPIEVSRLPGSLATLTLYGRYSSKVHYAGGRVEHFRHSSGGWQMHRLMREICTTRLGESKLTFVAGGVLHATHGKKRGDSLASEVAGSVMLADGSQIESDGLGYLHHRPTGREFCYLPNAKCWVELFVAPCRWTFGEILNGESTLSVEVLGLITAYASGAVLLWGSLSFARFEPIDEILLGTDQKCRLAVQREFGSDYLYLYEDASDTPTGVMVFVPDHFVGKDELTYNAWFFAASATSIPVGHPGISPVGTLLLLLVLLVGLVSFVVPTALSVLVAIGTVTWLGLFGRRLFYRTSALLGGSS